MRKYNFEKLEAKINRCKSTSLEQVNIEDVDNLSEVKIPKKIKGDERILEFIKNISNPYIFNIDGKIVKIEFCNNGRKAEDCIVNIMSSLYR